MLPRTPTPQKLLYNLISVVQIDIKEQKAKVQRAPKRLRKLTRKRSLYNIYPILPLYMFTYDKHLKTLYLLQSLNASNIAPKSYLDNVTL